MCTYKQVQTLVDCRQFSGYVDTKQIILNIKHKAYGTLNILSTQIWTIILNIPICLYTNHVHLYEILSILNTC